MHDTIAGSQEDHASRILELIEILAKACRSQSKKRLESACLNGSLLTLISRMNHHESVRYLAA